MRTAFILCFLFATTASAQIANIRRFLDQCPQNDPAIAQIRQDFVIRRAGVVVKDIPCSEPVSSMPTAEYTDELITLQSLRTIYYMDRGQSGHLPWTQGTLYDWLKTKVGGVNLVSGGWSYCCDLFDWQSPPPPPPPVPGEPPPPPPPPPPVPSAKYWYIAIGTEDDFNRDFDKTWRGISGQIALFAHEARHMDSFPHTSCCGIEGGCDQKFDPANLSPYGLQWWLSKLWLDGTINVGMGCLSPLELQASGAWFVGALAGSGFPERFCEAKPAAVPWPSSPGGQCLDPPRRRRAVTH